MTQKIGDVYFKAVTIFFLPNCYRWNIFVRKAENHKNFNLFRYSWNDFLINSRLGLLFLRMRILEVTTRYYSPKHVSFQQPICLYTSTTLVLFFQLPHLRWRETSAFLLLLLLNLIRFRKTGFSDKFTKTSKNESRYTLHYLHKLE